MLRLISHLAVNTAIFYKQKSLACLGIGLAICSTAFGHGALSDSWVITEICRGTLILAGGKGNLPSG